MPNRYQAELSKYKKINIILFSTIFILFQFSCKHQNTATQKQPELVFSEMDTFLTPVNTIQLDRFDYYLMKDFNPNKLEMKKKLDDFVRTHPEFKTGKYGNYLVFFYLEDSDLNKSTIEQTEPRFRYKLFHFNKNKNYLVSFTFRESKISDVDWNTDIFK